MLVPAMPLPRLPHTRPIAAIALLCGLAGCASDRMEILRQETPPPHGDTLVMDTIVPANPEWARAARHLRSRLADALTRDEGIALITRPTSTSTGKETLVLTGELVAIDEGSEAARFFIGMGFGAASLKGRFRILDAGGRPLLDFEQMRTSAAGSGFAAHFSPIVIDDEVDELAAAAAATVARWLAGEPPA